MELFMRLLKVLMLGFVVLHSGQAFSEVTLNGVSAYQQLSKEYYLGALFTTQNSQSSDYILQSQEPQTMVIRVTARKWSTRSFKGVWLEDIAMNNNLKGNLDLAEAVHAFTTIPNKSLVAGDEVTITFHPLTGTEVTLNKHTVLSYPNKKLFNALLRCWIGDVPPSRLFQSDILGAESIVTSNRESHLTRFNNLQIKRERVNLVASWREDEEKIQRALDLAAAEIKRRKKDELEARALLEQSRKNEPQAQANADSINETVDKTPIEKTTQLATINQETKVRQEQQDKELAKLKAKQTIRDYYTQVYEWEIAAQIHERVAYPEWGRQFELSGRVTLSFIVNRQGVLMGVTDIQPLNSGLLGDALQEALLKASPFKTFPEGLDDDQLAMSVSYYFDPNIDKPEKKSAPKPIKPPDFELLLRLASL